jgi:tight adherence protein C
MLLATTSALSLAMMLGALVLTHIIARRDRLARRVAALRALPETERADVLPPDGLRWLAALGEAVVRRWPASTVAELERSVAAAGVRRPDAVGLFIVAKLLLMAVLATLGLVLTRHAALAAAPRLLLTAAAGVFGLLLPDAALRRRGRRHKVAIERGLPDSLDMLVICIEAGLGLEAAMERVAGELAGPHAAVAQELRQTLTEMRFLADRRTALLNMGRRTGLEALKRLGATLIQSAQYGTPLNQALRSLATEMRYEMLVRFEAQATRLPVLLTVPMILFILPCVFIVVGGPAALTLIRSFTAG